MATVRTNCPVCRTSVKLLPSACQVFRCTSGEARDFLAFVCPSCDEPTTVPVTRIEMGLLTGSYAVRVCDYRLPAEFNDVQRDGPALSPYDAFDLRHDLERLDDTERAS